MKKVTNSKFYLIGLLSVIAIGAFMVFASGTAADNVADEAEQYLNKGEKAELALLKCGDEGGEKKCGEAEGEKKCGEGKKKDKECEGEKKKGDEGDKKCGEGDEKKCGSGDEEAEDTEEAEE